MSSFAELTPINGLISLVTALTHSKSLSRLSLGLPHAKRPAPAIWSPHWAAGEGWHPPGWQGVPGPSDTGAGPAQPPPSWQIGGFCHFSNLHNQGWGKQVGNYSLEMTLVFKASRSSPHSSWPSTVLGCRFMERRRFSSTHRDWDLILHPLALRRPTTQLSLAGSYRALYLSLLYLEAKPHGSPAVESAGRRGRRFPRGSCSRGRRVVCAFVGLTSLTPGRIPTGLDFLASERLLSRQGGFKSNTTILT